MASAARLGPPQSRALSPSNRQVELFMGRLHYRCYDSSLGDDAEAGAFCTCGTPAGGTRRLPRLDDGAPSASLGRRKARARSDAPRSAASAAWRLAVASAARLGPPQS